MSTLSRPQEPSILAASRERLEATLAEEWRMKRSRSADPDAVLQHPDLRAALLKMSRNTCAYCQRALDPVEQSGMVSEPPPALLGRRRRVGGGRLRCLLVADVRVGQPLPRVRRLCAHARDALPRPGAIARSPWRISRLSSRCCSRPCVDDPAEHLTYQLDGTVTALSERGQATTEVFALNREALVHARMAALERDRIGTPDPDDTEFATLRYQATIRFATARRPPEDPEPTAAVARTALEFGGTPAALRPQ